MRVYKFIILMNFSRSCKELQTVDAEGKRTKGRKFIVYKILMFFLHNPKLISLKLLDYMSNIIISSSFS